MNLDKLLNLLIPHNKAYTAEAYITHGAKSQYFTVYLKNDYGVVYQCPVKAVSKAQAEWKAIALCKGMPVTVLRGVPKIIQFHGVRH